MIVVTKVNWNLINSDYYEYDLEDKFDFLYQLGNEMVKNTYLNYTEESPSRRKRQILYLSSTAWLVLPPIKRFMDIYGVVQQYIFLWYVIVKKYLEYTPILNSLQGLRDAIIFFIFIFLMS